MVIFNFTLAIYNIHCEIVFLLRLEDIEFILLNLDFYKRFFFLEHFIITITDDYFQVTLVV